MLGVQSPTMKFGLVFGCGVVAVAASASSGCGGSTAPATSPETSSAPAPSPAQASESTAESKPASDAAPPSADASTSAPSSATTPQKPEPKKPTLTELCLQGCAKVKSKCSESAAETCRMNCTQYDHPPEGCETEAREALECARDAEDIPCVNIAPEICSYKFRRVVGCANGKPLEAKDDSPKVPAGWERYAAKGAGFSAVMPKGVTEGTEGGAPSYSVKDNNVTYSVRILPPPPEKPTQKNLVKVAMNLLGKCSQKLKLYGMVERPEKIFIRYDAKCPDAIELHGAFVFANGKMYVPTASAPKGSKAEADAFVYGFEVGK